MKRLMTEVATPQAQQAAVDPNHIVQAALQSTQQPQPAAAGQFDEKQMCLDSFLELLDYLLNNIAHVFPECQRTQDAQDDFRMARNSNIAQTRLIKAWHKTMKPHYQAVLDKDETQLRSAQLDWFQKLDIFTKWDDPGFSQESKDNMWSCLEQLNRMAGMYDSLHSIPSGVLTNIHGVAQEVLTSFQQGGSALDNLDIFELGQRVVSQSSSSDMNAFMAAMPHITQNLGGLDNLMKMMQGGMGGVAAEVQRAQQQE